MAEFAMCPGDECDLKAECLRFTSKPKMKDQNYMLPDERGENCGYFMPEEQPITVKVTDAPKNKKR